MKQRNVDLELNRIKFDEEYQSHINKIDQLASAVEDLRQSKKEKSKALEEKNLEIHRLRTKLDDAYYESQQKDKAISLQDTRISELQQTLCDTVDSRRTMDPNADLESLDKMLKRFKEMLSLKDKVLLFAK